METHPPNSPESSKRNRLLRFSIRSLFLLCALSAVMIVSVQFYWPRRTVVRFIPITQWDVQFFEPHLDALKAENAEIADLIIDRRTNGIMVYAQARHMEAAERVVERLIANPDPLLSLKADW
jgi:hypothetical protein